jgi:CRISPR-associated DxTHG motif protein
MKLITFVGTGRYEPVIYRWGEREHSTRFFSDALVEWLQPETTCVMLTKVARQHSNWQELEPLLRGRTEVREVHIPDGESEQELWQIFQRITEVVEPNDELVFDITHAFRSLPLLTLLATAYLKQVAEVRIRYILYGAYEARADGIAPAFDLTPFAELLDWLAAAKIFLTTGNAAELAHLLEAVQDEAWRARLAQPPRNLKSLANTLTEISNHLLLNRVPLLAESARRLQSHLDPRHEAHAEIAVWAPPLAPLLERIAQSYSAFANDDLRTQAHLIEWYHRHGHVMQAVTLAREWVISYRLVQQGKDWQDRGAREQMEQHLNAHAVQDALWSKVRDLRNDLAHCGFGRAKAQVLDVQSIQQRTREVVEEILSTVRSE